MKIPRDPDALTAEWLTEALASTGVLPHGRVASHDIELLGGDKGMTGRIARVRLGYDRALVDAPRSVIAKLSASDPDARASIHGMGFYERGGAVLRATGQPEPPTYAAVLLQRARLRRGADTAAPGRPCRCAQWQLRGRLLSG